MFSFCFSVKNASPAKAKKKKKLEVTDSSLKAPKPVQLIASTLGHQAELSSLEQHLLDNQKDSQDKMMKLFTDQIQSVMNSIKDSNMSSKVKPSATISKPPEIDGYDSDNYDDQEEWDDTPSEIASDNITPGPLLN